MYLYSIYSSYLYTECIRLITSDADIQSTTTITTVTTYTATNTTIASVVTSSSASVAIPSAAQITSAQSNAGMYCMVEKVYVLLNLCIYVCYIRTYIYTVN